MSAPLVIVLFIACAKLYRSLCGTTKTSIICGAKYHSPTIYANHYYTWKIEANTTGNNSICWGQIQCTSWILFAMIVFDDQRLLRTMQTKWYWHKWYESCQQPNCSYCSDSDTSCYPASVSAKEFERNIFQKFISKYWDIFYIKTSVE